jgi:hypothetical protein
MRGVILSPSLRSRINSAKNLPYGGQMFRLRLNMTTHQNTCDEPLTQALLGYNRGTDIVIAMIIIDR